MSQFPTYKFEDDDDDSSNHNSSKSNNQFDDSTSDSYDSPSRYESARYRNNDGENDSTENKSSDKPLSEVRFRSRRNSYSDETPDNDTSFSYEKSPPKIPDYLGEFASSDEQEERHSSPSNDERTPRQERTPYQRGDGYQRPPNQQRYGNNQPYQRNTQNRTPYRDQQPRQDGVNDNRGGGYRQQGYGYQRNNPNQQPNNRAGYNRQPDQNVDDDSRFNRPDANYSPREMGYQQQPRPRYNQPPNTGGQQRYPRQSNYQQRPPQQQRPAQQQRPQGYQSRPSNYQQRDDRQDGGGYRPRRNYEPRDNNYQPRDNRYEQRDPNQQQNRPYQQNRPPYQQNRPYQQRSTGGYYRNRPNYQGGGKSRPFYKKLRHVKGAKRLPKNFIADPTQAIKFTPLVKALTRLHYSSRNFALDVINAGRILVNNEVITKHNVIIDLSKDSIKLDDIVLTEFPDRLYILVHKKKHVSGSLEDGYSSIFNTLTRKKGWYMPAGCLEKSISGLVVLTNDPKHRTMSKSILGSIEKEYHFKINKKLTTEDIDIINQKLFAITSEKDIPSKVEFLQDTSKHQWLRVIIYGTSLVSIRKILKFSEAEVLSMHRHRIGTVTSEVVPEGAWVRLKPELVEHLYETPNPTETKKTTLWQQLSQKWFKST